MRDIKGWVNKSHKLPGLKENPMLAYDFQSLGRVDLDLVVESESIKNNDPNSIESALKLNRHATYARLWVIAGYELIRNIKKLDKHIEVKNVYEKFRRVRVPLVKFERVKDKKGKRYIERYPNDFDNVLAAISTKDGEYGWAVSVTEIITREDLAQDLYDLF
jgi:hypothetical protein